MKYRDFLKLIGVLLEYLEIRLECGDKNTFIQNIIKFEQKKST